MQGRDVMFLDTRSCRPGSIPFESWQFVSSQYAYLNEQASLIFGAVSSFMPKQEALNPFNRGAVGMFEAIAR